MKKIKEQLTWVSKTLAGLSKQVDKLARQISHMGLGDGRSGLTVKRSSARGPLTRRDTVLESVYEAIKTSRRGYRFRSLAGQQGPASSATL
jgi:hypothetical protein